MGVDCLERWLAKTFATHSRLLLRHPLPFCIIPILVAAFLGIGLFRLPNSLVKDDLELYTPSDARARRELRELDALFHINDSDPFYASRRFDLKRTGYIVIMNGDEDVEGNDDEDILNPKTLKAAAHLWSLIQSLAVDQEEIGDRNNQNENGNRRRSVAYPSLCVHFPLAESLWTLMGNNETDQGHKNQQFCVSNPLLELVKFALDQRGSAQQMLQNLSATLPTNLDNLADGGERFAEFLENNLSLDHLLGTGIRAMLGGISLDPETRRIAGAKALMLPYALRHGTEEEDALAQKWELKLADFLLGFRSPTIQANWWTYETVAAESSRDREQLQRMLLPCFLTVSLFTVLLCCSFSPIHSRPILALAGVFCVAMAISSALGLLLLFHFRFNSVVLSMPFIIFSVGIDNCFILLAAWRAAPSTLDLEARMARTFGEAGVSITITWLTDLLSFGVGCLTTFPSVQMFCLASAVALIFTFAFQLTLFGAIFALTSKREIQQKHCITVRPMTNKMPISNAPTNLALSRFFRTHYASFLLNKFTRFFVIFVFALYLLISAYGCLNIQLGLEPYDLLPENSYGKNGLRVVEKYFPDYGGYLHVWMHNLTRIRLSGHRRLWLVLEKEVELYEHTEFTGAADSWILEFLHFQKDQGVFTTNDNFVPRLKQFLELSKHRKYRRDIRFGKNGLELEATRVPIRLRFVGFQNQSRAMSLFRKLAESSELPTNVYADFFLFAEQYNSLVPGTVSSIAIAGLAVVLVSLLFIPESQAALWVSFSIVSINLGILGLMPFFALRLDFISMITIVMSIGFCVDFCAHLAHSFARSEGNSVKRMQNALYAVGTPIIQSASSTVLGVSFLASTESYIFRSFFKTISLVIGLGVLHGLVILPVLLTLFQWEENEPQILTTLNISSPMPKVPTFYGRNFEEQQKSVFHLHGLNFPPGFL